MYDVCSYMPFAISTNAHSFCTLYIIYVSLRSKTNNHNVNYGHETFLSTIPFET